MKRFLATTLLLFTTGCSLMSLSTVNYNNRIVSEMAELSDTVSLSSSTYNETLPSPVTEQSEIETSVMSTAMNAINGDLIDIDDLLNLKSKDDEQELQVRAKLQSYLEAANAYATAYSEMLNYYESEEFREDITKVKVHDDALYEAYNDFVQANNELAETLERYVQ